MVRFNIGPQKRPISTHHGTEEGSVYRTKVGHFSVKLRESKGDVVGCLNTTIATDVNAVGCPRAEYEL